MCCKGECHWFQGRIQLRPWIPTSRQSVCQPRKRIQHTRVNRGLTFIPVCSIVRNRLRASMSGSSSSGPRHVVSSSNSASMSNPNEIFSLVCKALTIGGCASFSARITSPLTKANSGHGPFLFWTKTGDSRSLPVRSVQLICRIAYVSDFCSFCLASSASERGAGCAGAGGCSFSSTGRTSLDGGACESCWSSR